MSAIIAGNPGDGKRTDVVRLEQALQLLVGWQPRKGMKPDNWELLKKIAWDYWCEYGNEVYEPGLEAIILKNKPAIAADDKSSINRIRKSFNKNKELLLRNVTGAFDEAQQTCALKESRICSLLADLGVSVEQPKVTE